MSYILDALKKAERDRLREDPKELDDFASSNWDPYQQEPKSDGPEIYNSAALYYCCGDWPSYLFRVINQASDTAATASRRDHQAGPCAPTY